MGQGLTYGLAVCRDALDRCVCSCVCEAEVAFDAGVVLGEAPWLRCILCLQR